MRSQEFDSITEAELRPTQINIRKKKKKPSIQGRLWTTLNFTKTPQAGVETDTDL